MRAAAALREDADSAVAPPAVAPAVSEGTSAGLGRRGHFTVISTTGGVGAVLELGRGTSLRMYGALYGDPASRGPRGRRLEVSERVTARGEVLTPLDEAAVGEAARRLAD